MFDSNQNSLIKILSNQSIDPIPNCRYKRLICKKIFENQNQNDNDNGEQQQQPNVFAFDQVIFRQKCSFQFELLDNLIILFKANNHHILYQINTKFYDELEQNGFVEEIANHIDHDILQQQQIIRCQFYPYDLGLYSSLCRERLNIYDTIRQELIQTLPIRNNNNRKQFYQMDWNRLTFVSIALACDNSETLIFDHRTNHTSLSLIINDPCIKNNETTKCQTVYWSPQDENGLFIGTRAGSIHFYDIRQTRRPLASHLSSYLYRHPVVHISMTPDHQNLITIYPTYQNIFRWKINRMNQMNQFLKEMPLFIVRNKSSSTTNLSNDNNSLLFKKYKNFNDIHFRFEHMQPFITNEYLTLYSRTMNGKIENINYTFNETKKYVDESILTKNTNFWPKKLSLSTVDNNFGHHPLSTLFYGYRSTNQGDESMPALFYKANNVFVVRRLRLANDDDDFKQNFRKQQPMENEDRWSSDSE
ncbi:uncharacterized protein LOC113796441 [Dermatophagoides pteronyssinus]|uniref:uncharacterized protein LOC113796441 n=1 Tax=Dermatophagoides pteronyssinus TaxID=6956 RepID=UPI003F66C0FA